MVIYLNEVTVLYHVIMQKISHNKQDQDSKSVLFILSASNNNGTTVLLINVTSLALRCLAGGTFLALDNASRSS